MKFQDQNSVVRRHVQIITDSFARTSRAILQFQSNTQGAQFRLFLRDIIKLLNMFKSFLKLPDGRRIENPSVKSGLPQEMPNIPYKLGR